MSSEKYSILPLMFSVVNRIDNYHPNGVAVSQPSVLVPRSHILEVYNEGLIFSGIYSVGRAETCIAPTPAPHIPASISKEQYLGIASEIFNSPKLYPKYDSVNYMSPQVTLWWRRSNDSKAYDFIDINNLSQNEQVDFSNSISRTTKMGVELVEKMKGKPIIWGTWGHGLEEEREKEGLTRGGPTLKEGHLHVSYFKPEEQMTNVQKVSNKDKLNHYAPWNEIILEKFGSLLGNLINTDFKKVLEGEVKTVVSRVNKIEVYSNQSASILNGFELGFEKPVPLSNVILSLIGVAGNLENIYKNIHRIFNDCNKSHNEREKDMIHQEMCGLFLENEISEEESSELAKFILSIQPTYGQLLDYGQEDNIKKYERVREKINNHKNKSLLMDIVLDALKEPSDKSIGFTFPVHASFCYIINDYVVKDDEIYVHSINLYPQFATTESGPERTLGLILKRPTTQQK